MTPSIQQHAVNTARTAAEEFFRYARAVPADRLEWKPMEAGQSVLAMCREIAMTPKWAVIVTTGRETTPAERETSYVEMGSWSSVDECVSRFTANFEEWAALVLSLTDEDLKKTRWLPYNGGRDHTYLEMLEYPRWNATYHLGQVAYIQTLYGDREMH